MTFDFLIPTQKCFYKEPCYAMPAATRRYAVFLYDVMAHTDSLIEYNRLLEGIQKNIIKVGLQSELTSDIKYLYNFEKHHVIFIDQIDQITEWAAHLGYDLKKDLCYYSRITLFTEDLHINLIIRFFPCQSTSCPNTRLSSI